MSKSHTPVEVRRAERELLFHTPRESLLAIHHALLIVLLAAVVAYTVISILGGSLAAESQILRQLSTAAMAPH